MLPLKVGSGGISDFLFYENFIFQWNVDATPLKWNGYQEIILRKLLRKHHLNGKNLKLATKLLTQVAINK